MVIRSRRSLKREALHSLIIDIMTRLNVSPTDRHFIQILGHILLAVYAESICNILVLKFPSCIVTFFVVI